MISDEQQAVVDRRRSELREPRALQVTVFSGDVYIRSSLGHVVAVDPDGVIRQDEEWPTRGVSLLDMEASQRAIEEALRGR